VRYTIWSRGRLVGETTLSFVRLDEWSRSGWFIPTEEGERLVAGIATPLLSTEAKLRRRAEGDESGDSQTGTVMADLAEISQHVGALELELRREDGSVVSTEDIGFQDVERLIALGEMAHDDDEELPEWEASEIAAGDDDDEQMQANLEHDLRVIEEQIERMDRDWVPEEESDQAAERYQVFVMLAEANAIP
jgi:hypothetical protein